MPSPPFSFLHGPHELHSHFWEEFLMRHRILGACGVPKAKERRLSSRKMGKRSRKVKTEMTIGFIRMGSAADFDKSHGRGVGWTEGPLVFVDTRGVLQLTVSPVWWVGKWDGSWKGEGEELMTMSEKVKTCRREGRDAEDKWKGWLGEQTRSSVSES